MLTAACLGCDRSSLNGSLPDCCAGSGALCKAEGRLAGALDWAFSLLNNEKATTKSAPINSIKMSLDLFRESNIDMIYEKVRVNFIVRDALDRVFKGSDRIQKFIITDQ